MAEHAVETQCGGSVTPFQQHGTPATSSLQEQIFPKQTGAVTHPVGRHCESLIPEFFTLWKDADTDIPVLKQAKEEYAKLQ